MYKISVSTEMQTKKERGNLISRSSQMNYTFFYLISFSALLPIELI